MNYFDKPGLSFHELKDFGKSPRFYYEKHVLRVIADQDKASYAFGRAVHCRTLEGADEFARRFIAAPPEHITASGALSTSKATKEWRSGLALGVEVIGSNDADRVATIAARVGDNVYARELLASGTPEVEVLADFGGVAVKGRCDWLCPARKLVLDLKTTRDLDAFAGDCWAYGYDQQLAWYMDLTGATDHALLVVESDQPHRVAVMRFDAAALSDAHARNCQLLARYRECQASDTWPGDPAEIITLTRPAA